MARALVTGGTGFIGRHLTELLLGREERVRCFARRPGPPGAESVIGDITCPDAIAGALTGIDVVYHLAGATLPPRGATYETINALGCARVAEACAEQPTPPTLVYVSSLAAVGPSRDGLPVTELTPPQPVSEYGKSKLRGEANLRPFAGKVPISVVRPPAVFGPGEPHLVRLFGLAKRRLHVVPGRADVRLAWVHVADLAESLVLAANVGERLPPPDSGDGPDVGVYLVALDEQPTMSEVASIAASHLGTTIKRTIHLPVILCQLAARLNHLRCRLRGRASWLNPDKMREATSGPWICSSEKAKRELGFACRVNLHDGFGELKQWYTANGML